MSIDANARSAQLIPGSVHVAEPLDCQIAGALIRIMGLPTTVRARAAELFRPFVLPPASMPATPCACLQAVRRGRGDWIVRLNSTDGACEGEGHMEGGGRIGHLLAALEWRAVGIALSATVDSAVVHGATLARGDRTILLLGRSGAGKTTLTLGLMGRGWEPFTDDITLVDTKSLEIRSFPRCFHVDAATLAALPTRPELEWSTSLAGYCRPTRWAQQARQPATVVLVERNPLRATELRPVTRAEVAGAILDATIKNRLTGSILTDVAVRLAWQAQQCCALNNVSLSAALDLIEAATFQSVG